MKKQDLTTTGLLAHTGYYGTPDPVRLLDARLWRMDTWSNRGRQFEISAASRPSRALSHEIVGYPVLGLYGEGTMTKGERYAAETFLAETELTMADLIDQEGRDIPGVLPKHVSLRVVSNRRITGPYAIAKAEFDAAEAEIQRLAEAETARQATRAATGRKFVDELDALGVNNMITMVSEHSVTVDVRTLEALIALARKADEKAADKRNAVIATALGHALTLADPADEDCQIDHRSPAKDYEIRHAVGLYVHSWIAQPLAAVLGAESLDEYPGHTREATKAVVYIEKLQEAYAPRREGLLGKCPNCEQDAEIASYVLEDGSVATLCEPCRMETFDSRS